MELKLLEQAWVKKNRGRNECFMSGLTQGMRQPFMMIEYLDSR